MLMRQSDGTDTLDFQYDAAGIAAGFNYNSTPYFYVRNLQGDVVAVIDADGTIVAEYSYDAWGNITAASGAMVAINPIRYRGYYQDPVTGWYFLQSRYYLPEWRRFLNADSLFIAGDDVISGSNMYAYCNGNPVMYVDPSGMGVVDWIRSGWTKIKDAYNSGADKISAAYGRVADKVSQATSAPFGKWFGPKIGCLTDKTQFLMGGALTTIFGLWGMDWTDKQYVFDGVKLFGVLPLQFRPYFQKEFTQIQTAAGAWALDFHMDRDWRSPNYRNYRTLPGSYQWQHHVGYIWWYDFCFSVGGPTDKKKYTFVVDDDNGPFSVDTEYVVWVWKADYWNLGAGAEIGIYYQGAWLPQAMGYYKIDTENLKVSVKMNVFYGTEQITTDFVQTNWWVTSFTPDIQSPDVNNLDVHLKVAFAGQGEHSSLFVPFFTKWNPLIIAGSGDGLSWADSNDTTYEFYINY